MFSNQTSTQLGNPQRNPATTITELLKIQRRRVFVCTVVYALAAGGTIVACAAIMLIRFADWLKTLPKGVEPTLAQLSTDRPEIWLVSCLGGAIGVTLAVGGLWMWRCGLGRDNAPPQKIVLILGGMPIALGCLGAVMTAAKPGLVGVVAVPLLLGGTVAIVPFVIGIMAFGLLQLALSFLGQSPVACRDDELPPNVAQYFDQFNVAARAAGLEFAGNFCFVPKRTKHRRVWIAPNGVYFVDATHFSQGSTTIAALSVSSATEDGHFFETTDLSHPRLPSSDGLDHCQQVPGASLAELIERHIEIIGNWAEQTGSRPLIFAATDQHELFAYGLAAHLQHEQSEIFWLGNPYKNQPLPPLPGRTWEGQDAMPEITAAVQY